MAKLIDADYAKMALASSLLNSEDRFAYLKAVASIDSTPTVDAVPVCRCAECKHRPSKPEKYDDGFDLAFPDEVCPCYCDGDPFYSWYPKDDWFCPRGERKGGEE